MSCSPPSPVQNPKKSGKHKMSQAIMLVPIGSQVGLTSVSMGVVRAFERQGYPVKFFKPIEQGVHDHSYQLVQKGTGPLGSITMTQAEVERLLAKNQRDLFLEKVITICEQNFDAQQLLIMEGLINTATLTYGMEINQAIAQALGADVILVASAEDGDLEALEKRIDIAADSYGGIEAEHVVGCIVNKIGAPPPHQSLPRLDVALPAQPPSDWDAQVAAIRQLPIFNRAPFKLLGTVPWSGNLLSPRVKDLASYLSTKVLNAGDMEHRRVRSIALCSRTVPNLVSHLLPGALLVTAGDRSDIIMAAALSVMNGVKLGGLLLTGGYEPEANIQKLCQQAFQSGLPVLQSPCDTWTTSLKLLRYPYELPADDEQRIERVKEHVASQIDREWIQYKARHLKEIQLSPPAFRHLLTKKAQCAHKSIVLPEGEEPRTIKAAAYCAQHGIAHCLLLGKPDVIRKTAQQRGISLETDGIEILDPELLRPAFVAPLVALRQHKGLNEIMAQELLQDNVVLGTLMLHAGKVDGLVSGAVHTTANTIRPALQLIKTAPGNSLVSSIFFMLLPDRVLVYGDCAINTDPNASELAEIAVQSARSAQAFGLEPRVAMISYSTGRSGTGADVDKVRQATELAQQLAPDLLIDGPLQYDAAIMPDVAHSKAPDSPVAGQANVFIFPDLNTGNTTYKAVQRSAHALSIGPMLQGLNKPVNDLSRGALVDDIIYTIALTAIQALQAEQREA